MTDKHRVLYYPRFTDAYLRANTAGTGPAPSRRHMSKRRKQPRKIVDRSATVDVVTQLECAIRNPHAALIGAVIGGLVPWFGRTLAHDQVPAAWDAGSTGLALTMVAVVLGCALFSALSVYKFGKAAFGDTRKALGFVLALEGVMLVSHGVTSTIALAVLILINAVANGSVIALARDATKRRCEADMRRVATRARGRTATPARSTEPAVATDRRPAGRALVAPVWRHTTRANVIDAEIVSEARLS